MLPGHGVRRPYHQLVVPDRVGRTVLAPSNHDKRTAADHVHGGCVGQALAGPEGTLPL